MSRVLSDPVKLNANLNLSRYEWGEAVLNELHSVALSDLVILVIDVGAGDGRMEAVIHDCGARSSAFDLSPQNPQIRAWNLENPIHTD